MFRLLSRTTSKQEQLVGDRDAQDKQSLSPTAQPVSKQAEHVSESLAPTDPAPTGSTPLSQTQVVDASTPVQQSTSRSQKRFSWSWHSLVHPKGVQDRKPALPPPQEEAAKEATVRQEYTERLILRPFATPTVVPPKSSKVSVTAASSLQKVQKVKAQLLDSKSAQKVIAQLRTLPTSDHPVVVGKTITGKPVETPPRGPIHAVCLPYTDAEADEKHFSKLDKLEVAAAPSNSPSASPKTKEQTLYLTAVSSAASQIACVTATSLEKLKEVFAELNVVSLITTPDLGLGQPADGPGLLSGAIPSATAVVHGIEEITPQLMALGYATGKAVLPSHTGVYPPTDRMSVITYWWGLEVVMPEPSVKYLSNVPSIAHTVINFLTALAVANGGIREILPFIRYISQYIDAEWNLIQQADQGQGVVCAATWIMPAALVPRAWDFPQPPVPSPPAPMSGSDGVSSAEPSNTTGGQGQDAAASAQKPPPPTTRRTTPSAPTADNPTLLTPPLPAHNDAPVFVAPAGDPSAHVSGSRGDPAAGVPGVTVTPPTPPASETLGRAAGEAFQSAVGSTSPGASAGGDAPAAVVAAG
ncbi:hypothetical protein BN946_scf184941.g34 [Trametes cinnabarina]|uniref:Uncharacterized protein n=1 Tax=Pycnoporus cinnabarinus TaxID=5643 RepID=A0A060SND3_PYCCI|nr:hypothetical protein BN946_scf184941.g34 [Trametes cinnabarina]